ncbi:hypothetical protein Tco_1126522 [Tanacetum coccineum]
MFAAMAGFIIVVVEIDPYLGGAHLIVFAAVAGAGHQFTVFAPMAPLISWRASAKFGLQPWRVTYSLLHIIVSVCCWIVKVVISSDLGGAARHHVCSHAVFDAALSFPAIACLSQSD